MLFRYKFYSRVGDSYALKLIRTILGGDKNLMTEVYTETKAIIKDELYSQYNWYYNSFLNTIQVSSNDFFSDLFSFQLVSLSKNINILFQGDDYFVTKIRIDKQHDVFFRGSEGAIKIILDNVLGESKKKFQLSNISELEAKIISSFNDYLFNNISPILLPAPPKNQKRKNFNTINLTLFIKDKKNPEGGKFIISLPEILLNPVQVVSQEEKFDISNFNRSKVDVNIKVGTTRFPIKDLKHLEKEDIVIFDNSNVKNMQLIYKDYKRNFKINPNLGLITSIDNDGGNHMEENSLPQNLWDNIQVEMGAEFDKVKITLGELKNIEQGLVVDISSVYNNKISLKVENKIIANGELVIINDRYGVRINEIFTGVPTKVDDLSQPRIESADGHQQEHEQVPQQTPAVSEEEEFDYSDFELDDEDI